MLFWWRAHKQTREGKHSKPPIWDTGSKGIQQRIRLDSAKPAEGNRAAKCAFVVIPAAGALIAIKKRWRKKWVGPLWKWNKVRGSSERTQQPNLGASGPGRLPTPLEQRRAWTARGEAPPAQFSKKTAYRRGQQIDVSTLNGFLPLEQRHSISILNSKGHCSVDCIQSDTDLSGHAPYGAHLAR